MRLQSTALLLLSTSLAVASGGGLQSSWEQRQRGACDNVLPAAHPKVPCLLVPKCGSRAGHATAKPYVLANGNGSAAQATEARVCFTSDELCADPSLPPAPARPLPFLAGPLDDGRRSGHRRVAYTATDDNTYSNYVRPPLLPLSLDPNHHGSDPPTRLLPPLSLQTKCHDPVWQDDALELMLYPGALTADPTGNYTEIDLGPKECAPHPPTTARSL